MVLPTTGQISLQALQNEFGGERPISITEYYRNAGIVANRSENFSIPASGFISMSDFRGKSGFDVRVLTAGAGAGGPVGVNPSIPCLKRTILVIQSIAAAGTGLQPAAAAIINNQTGRLIFGLNSTAYDDGQAVTVTSLTVPDGYYPPVYIPAAPGAASSYYAVFAIYSPLTLIQTDVIRNTDGGDRGLPSRSNTIATPAGSFVLYIAENNGNGGPLSDLTGRMSVYFNFGVGIGFDYNPIVGSTTYSYAGNEPRPALLAATSFYKD